MKTLYVSDLDGTLLRSDETISAHTNDVINSLVGNGMLFSYATARSFNTARKVTAGLSAKIPVIVYNGTFVIDNNSGEIMISNFFEDGVRQVLDDLIGNGIYPIVYSMIDGAEKFSYVYSLCTDGAKEFIATRRGDKRDNPVNALSALYYGELFYLTCIGDDEEKLRQLYDKYREQYHCVFQRDIYTAKWWLEIMPKAASKANAIAQLKEQLCCDRLVVFGDGKNDIDMFELADESYAVSNAAEELKAIATGIIGSNNSDGVADFLLRHYR